MTYYGIDVSYYQGNMDWEKAKDSGIEFAIIRTGDGQFYDPQFERNWEVSDELLIFRSAYHYMNPNVSALMQTGILLKRIEDTGLDEDFFVSLDCEERGNLSKVEYTFGIVNAIQYIYDEWGYYPGIYTRQTFWDANTIPNAIFQKCPLWVANWDTSSPRIPRDWKDYTIWQYEVYLPGSDYGSQSKAIDMDQWNGTPPWIEEPPPVQESKLFLNLVVKVGESYYDGNGIIDLKERE